MKFWVKIIKNHFCFATNLVWQGDAGKGWEVDEKEGGGEDGWEDDGDWGELEVGQVIDISLF